MKIWGSKMNPGIYKVLEDIWVLNLKKGDEITILPMQYPHQKINYFTKLKNNKLCEISLSFDKILECISLEYSKNEA